MSKSRWVTGRSWGMGAAIVPPSGPGGGGEEARAPAGRPGLRTRTPGLPRLPGRSAHAQPRASSRPRSEPTQRPRALSLRARAKPLYACASRALRKIARLGLFRVRALSGSRLCARVRLGLQPVGV